MSRELFGITWAHARYWPVILLFFVLSCMLLFLRHRSTRYMVRNLVGFAWQSLLANFSPQKLIMKMILLFGGILFFSLALLRPQLEEREQTVKQEGRDLLVALDISRSMLANDIKPNRLGCAKNKIKKLVDALKSERVGLIVFSGSSFLLCPLTSDRNAFSLFLDQVDLQTIASGTTAIDTALAKAVEVYERAPGKKTKLLVVLTDGEDFSSNLSALKAKAEKERVRIFTLGVATPGGAPIPFFDHQGRQVGHIKDENNKVVISKLNEGILRSLAHDVGGVYLPVSQDDEDVKQVEVWVSRFEKEIFDDLKLSLHEDQYPWFLLGSFLCFLLEWIL